jgi:hypothetical protein
MKYIKNLTNGPDFLRKSNLQSFQFNYLFFRLRRDYRRLHMVNGRTWDRYHGCKYRDSASCSRNALVATRFRISATIYCDTANWFL